MVNKNNKKFWDFTNAKEEANLVKSSIYREKINFVLSLLKSDSGKLLDIGVGNGYLEQKLKDNYQLYGIDIATNSIKKINININGKFIVANAKKLPYESCFFDKVIALDILEHFTKNELDQVVSEIYRVLKKSGKFILSVPINESDKDRLNNRHYYIFEEVKLAELFNSYKFNVISLKYFSAFRNLFIIKNFINNIFNFRKHNLAILVCKKK